MQNPCPTSLRLFVVVSRMLSRRTNTTDSSERPVQAEARKVQWPLSDV